MGMDGMGGLPLAPMGPSWPVDDTMTLDSSTLGSMHICVSWLRETRVQLVTAPPTYLPRSSSSRTIKSSTAVALKSLMLGACSTSSSEDIADTIKLSKMLTHAVGQAECLSWPSTHTSDWQ